MTTLEQLQHIGQIYAIGMVCTAFLVGLIEDDLSWKNILTKSILWPIYVSTAAGAFVRAVIRGIFS